MLVLPVQPRLRGCLRYGDPPFYGQVHRDNARLNLRLVREPGSVGDIRERELLSASITVRTAEQIEELFTDYQSAGVRIHQTVRTERWGCRTFILVDTDGNLIFYAASVE